MKHAPDQSIYNLSIVIPTFNERDNIYELLERLEGQLQGLRWEVIFVDDDSPDGTSDVIRHIGSSHIKVRCIQRIGRRGLSSACVEGILSSSAPVIAVMDADLQHDERILSEMYETLFREELDIIVGSRYSEGGSIGSWSKQRAMISRLAGRLSRGLVPPDLKDPMSGFFMISRPVFMECVRNLSTLGFKILLDIFASSPRPLRFAEIPYQFRNRYAGESKLDSQVAWDFVMLLLDKTIGHLVPVRFISFAFVGGLGLLVHMGVLSVVYLSETATFAVAQAIASIAAIVFNFTLNNRITYRDRRLHGVHWWRGLASFFAACAVGALANIGVAQYLFSQRQGWFVSALAGVAVAAVWNYAVTANYTWKTSKK